MGFSVHLDSDDHHFVSLLRERPAELFTHPYAGFMLFLFTEETDREVYDWFHRNARELDAMTGETIAFGVLTPRVEVTIRTEGSHRNSPANLGEVPLSTVRIHELTPLVRSGKFGWVYDGDRLAVCSEAVYRVQEQLGISKRQLPCIVAFDAIPSPENPLVVVPLAEDAIGLSSLLKDFRRVVADVEACPRFAEYKGCLKAALDAAQKAKAFDAARPFLPNLPARPTIKGPTVLAEGDYVRVCDDVRAHLLRGNARRARRAIRQVMGDYQAASGFYHATTVPRIRRLIKARHFLAAQSTRRFRSSAEALPVKHHEPFEQEVVELLELDAVLIGEMDRAELLRRLDASIEAEIEPLMSLLPKDVIAAFARDQEVALAAWASEVRCIEAAHTDRLAKWERDRAAPMARARSAYQDLLGWENRPSLCRLLQAYFGGREAGDTTADVPTDWANSDPADEISRGDLFDLLCRFCNRLTFAYRVFISYRREGGADRAELIARELRVRA